MNTLVAPKTLIPADAKLLKRGERLLEPDVYITRKDDTPIVVKSYRRYAHSLLALPARVLVRHEAKILRQLDGWKHAPALIGASALALGMEFIPGETLTIGAEAGRDVFEQLQVALSQLHAAGITHNDLHGTNVVVHDGTPVLVDFTSASWMPRWLRSSFLARQLRRSDWKHLFKLRQRATGLAPTPEQAERVAEPRWVRSIRAAYKRLYQRIRLVGAH